MASTPLQIRTTVHQLRSQKSSKIPKVDENVSLHFFKDDALGVRSALERIGLPAGAQVGLLVVLVCPYLDTTVVDVLASSSQTGWLTHFYNSHKFDYPTPEIIHN